MAGKPPGLLPAIILMLEARPDGIGEYELLRQLQQQGLLPRPELSDTLGLFRIHFELYHHLYLLRDEWWQAETAHLHISALLIQIQEYCHQPEGLDFADPLRAFYLDRSQLDTTQQEDVDRLMRSFWRILSGADNRQQALETLGLEDPVDSTKIKRRYREMAMQFHPDRGGDPAQFHRIQQALKNLLPER